MGFFANLKKKRTIKSNNESKQSMLHKNLKFAAKEQYKQIRENLSFVLPQDEKSYVIGVTSSVRGEGKSTTVINLASVLAEKDKTVLIIDADLRIPTIAKKLGIEKTPGLSNFLVGKTEKAPIYSSNINEKLFILPSGDIPPNPSELLGSERMARFVEKLRDSFDFVIIDTPPVNLVSDALALSPVLSGLIVVTRESFTEKRELKRCFRQLKLSEVKVLGTILNDASEDHAKNYRKSKYRYYRKSDYLKTDYLTPKPEDGNNADVTDNVGNDEKKD
ncbi:MAG: CpsD/CapB family tyrosine-protein kinase [Clostridia bacterium]|nr:CpsD/CapB family tyrosine-protein kinase [Clostridia bacterium]